jgi:hypothetical protein
MGGLVVGLVMSMPLYFLAKYLVDVYRDKMREKIANNRFVKAVMRQPILTGLKNKFSSAVRFYDSIR